MTTCRTCKGTGLVIARTDYCVSCGQSLRTDVPGHDVLPISYTFCPGCGRKAVHEDEHTVTCMACGGSGDTTRNA